MYSKNCYKAFLVCLVALIGWAQAILPQATDDQAALKAWETFVQTYQKTYATDEEYQQRKEQFLKNYESYGEQNKKAKSSKLTYKIGVTKFADLSVAEFIKLNTGLNVSANTYNQNRLPESKKHKVGLAANFDWRDTGYVVSSVKNQGRCGSCWAFATVTTVEGAYNKKRGYGSSDFSEQQLVDCDGNNNGCYGGWPSEAFHHIAVNGAATEANYPYKAVRGTCQSVSTTPISMYWYFMWYASDYQMQYYLSNYGPMTVAIDATPLQSYKGGVLNTASCSSINHAVNLVGYVTSGPDAPYYILKNSWGTNWGENGYFRVSMNNPCFIKDYIWFIDINN